MCLFIEKTDFLQPVPISHRRDGTGCFVRYFDEKSDKNKIGSTYPAFVKKRIKKIWRIQRGFGRLPRKQANDGGCWQVGSEASFGDFVLFVQ
jgi:hypothetical protein